jgi:hypothetical protein
VTLRNNSTVPVRVDAVIDTVGTTTTAVCASLLNTQIAPNTTSAPCTFSGTAPAAGQSLIDVIQATVSQVGDPSNTTDRVHWAEVISR